MVKVLTLTAEEGSEYLAPPPLVSGPLSELAGVRQGPAWTPPPVDLVTSEGKRQRRTVDCPFLLGGLLAVKDAALARVRPVLEPYAEFLPLDCPQVAVTAVNVLQVLDVLDEERSDVARFSSGRMMLVDMYAFRAQALPEKGVFRLAQLPGAALFFTEETALVLQQELTGLRLTEVWDSEGPSAV